MVNKIDELVKSIILIRIEIRELTIDDNLYYKYRLLHNTLHILIDDLNKEDKSFDIRFESSMDNYLDNYSINKYGFNYEYVTLSQFKRHIILNELV